MSSLIGTIMDFFGSTASKVLLAALLITLSLLAWEKHTNAGLNERIGGNDIVIASQARAIDELRKERARAEAALLKREVEYAGISKQLQSVKTELAKTAKSDPVALAWSFTPVPAAYDGVLRNSDSGPDRSCPPDPSGSVAQTDSRAELAW